MQADARFYNGVSSRAFDVHITLSENKKLLLETQEEPPLEISLHEVTILHQEKNLLTFTYGSLPRKIIEIRDPAFIKACYKALPQKSIYHQLLNAKRQTHILLAIAVISAMILSYFFLLPIAAEHAVSFLPLSFDQKLGKEAYEQMQKEDDFKIDTAASVSVNNYAAEMYPERKNFFKITVIEREEYNAFALPDGHIVIYSALLKDMDNQSELAGLLSHEMSHVERRHTMRLMCKNLAGYFLLSLLINDVNGMMTVLINNANTLQQLSFSRNFEREADINGFHLLEKQKIDPHGMIKLFSLLKKKEGKYSVPGFISTHPVTTDRINYLNKEITNHPYSYTAHPTLEALFNQAKNEIAFTSEKQ